MILIIAVIMGAFMISAQAADATNNAEQTEMIRVVVGPGDTLWHLVQEYNPDYSGDIREAINRIQKLNNIEGGMIHPGDVIMIPVE